MVKEDKQTWKANYFMKIKVKVLVICEYVVERLYPEHILAMIACPYNRGIHNSKLVGTLQ